MKRILALITISLVVLPFPASAAPPDFSLCDGLQGAAAGLCRAAIAVGCLEDGSSNACLKIAEQYERITGNRPPFLGASLSNDSGAAGLCLGINDPQGRLALDDLVMIYSPGMDPSSGYLMNIFAPTYTPEYLQVSVPQSLSPGPYLVSVLANDTELSLKIGPLEFEVLDLGGVPPSCGR